LIASSFKLQHGCGDEHFILTCPFTSKASKPAELGLHVEGLGELLELVEVQINCFHCQVCIYISRSYYCDRKINHGSGPANVLSLTWQLFWELGVKLVDLVLAPSADLVQADWDC